MNFTFQRPASRPYFLVTSSADVWDLISSVFSFTALTLSLEFADELDALFGFPYLKGAPGEEEKSAVLV